MKDTIVMTEHKYTWCVYLEATFIFCKLSRAVSRLNPPPLSPVTPYLISETDGS